MAELEIHHESSEHDPQGKRVGALAAIIAVLLAVVTILSHRAHTDAVIYKTEANDQWSFYQAKSLKGHSLSVGRDLLTALGATNDATRTMLDHYAEEQKRYEKESDQIRREAQHIEKEASLVERRAVRYDIGEGLLEIGLVLSSLYFIARRHMFPVTGLIAAISGVLIAISGILVH